MLPLIRKVSQMFFSTHRLQYEGKEHRDRFILSIRVIDPDKKKSLPLREIFRENFKQYPDGSIESKNFDRLGCFDKVTKCEIKGPF